MTMVVMLAIGSTIRLADLAAVVRQPRALLVGLAGQQILVPAAGLVLASGLAGPSCLALAIVAVMPGGVASTIFTAAAGGNTALSAVLTLCSNVMVAVWVPLLLSVSIGICDTGALTGDLDFVVLAIRLALVSAVPLMVGMIVAAVFPRFTARFHPYLGKLATTFFVVFVAWILWDDRANLASYLTGAGVLVPLLLLFAVGTAWLASGLLRFPEATRTALVFEWGIQNVPLAILVALTLGSAQTLALPAASYGLLQIAGGLLIALVLGRRSRRLSAA